LWQPTLVHVVEKNEIGLDWLCLWYLMPLSAIFQLYRGG